MGDSTYCVTAKHSCGSARMARSLESTTSAARHNWSLKQGVQYSFRNLAQMFHWVDDRKYMCNAAVETRHRATCRNPASRACGKTCVNLQSCSDQCSIMLGTMIDSTADFVAQTLGAPLHHITLGDGQVSPTAGTCFLCCLEQESINPTGRR